MNNHVSEALSNLLQRPCTRRTAVLTGVVASASLAISGCSFAGNAEKNASTSEASASGTTTPQGWILQEVGTLNVAAWLDNMPFEGESGFQTQGFSYELMQCVTEELGLQLAYVSAASKERVLTAVSEGTKVDIGVSSLEPTLIKNANLLATNSYLELKLAVSVNRSSEMQSVDDVTGVRVGVVANSTQQTWAHVNLNSCEVVEYENNTFLFAALQAQNVNAVVSSLEVARYFVRTMLPSVSIIHQEPSTEAFAVALSPNNTALCTAINNALDVVRANGTYDALYDSWFTETSTNTDTHEYRTPEQGAPGYAKGA